MGELTTAVFFILYLFKLLQFEDYNLSSPLILSEGRLIQFCERLPSLGTAYVGVLILFSNVRY